MNNSPSMISTTQLGPDDAKPTGQNRANVRFTQTQHERLARDAEATGMSVPTLLKTAYFKRQIVRVLLDQRSALSTLASLHRISDLLNQVALKLNAGFREGFNEPLTKAMENLAALRSFVGGVYGNR